MSEPVIFKIGSMVVRKSKATTKFHSQFKQEAMKRRTAGEIWAEKIINDQIARSQFIVEHVFQFRRFDFFFPFIKVAIEVDGGYHNTAFQKSYDSMCDAYLLKNYKIKVFRVKNFDSIGLSEVLNQVSKLVHSKETAAQEAVTLSISQRRKVKEKKKARDLHKKLFFEKHGMTEKAFIKKRRLELLKTPAHRPQVILRRKYKEIEL